MASIMTAPTPRVTKPCKTSKGQSKHEKKIGGKSGAHSDMNEMPVGRMTVIRAVLAHRSHVGPVLEGETPDGYGLEELGEGLILGEIGLEKEEICDRALRALGRSEHTAG